MKLISAVDINWGIGKGNDLLFHISKDMKNFRSLTEDNVIIIGRKTLESFPGQKPLKNRVNIVLTKNLNYNPENCVIAHSIEELFLILKDYQNKEIYVCGGEQIYKLLEPYCNEAIITKINSSKEADYHFPILDENNEWTVISESENFVENEISFKFVNYKRIK